MGEHLQQLRCFTTVGEQQADVLLRHHPEISVQGIGGIKEEGHQADGGKGGCDLARHDAALAHASDHKLGFAIGAAFQQAQGRFHFIAAQPFRCRGDGGGFLLQTASESGQRRDP
ncbi:MAG: Uncharacterised protein [Synechococcus sp. CC9902]|nr:MAG: Uncharacterised protein [Synechococcus sp. CC9902]